jgi:predicted nucleic acid-binding Zn ribbon protein
MALTHIGDALKSLSNTGRLKNGLRTAQLDTIWEKMMGQTIGRYTDKIEIINQTLFVTTAVGALKNELHFQKELIIRRLNEELGETVVTNLVIR